MPMEITPPRISSKDMAASQAIAGVEIEAGGPEKAEAGRYKNEIDHHRKPQIER